VKPGIIQNFREISDAFCDGLAAASEQLGELTNFDEMFGFTPVSIHLHSAAADEENYENGAEDCCLLEVLDQNVPIGYAGLIFREGEARKLVGAILKSMNEAGELDEAGRWPSFVRTLPGRTSARCQCEIGGSGSYS
jgi:hypothetical protein